MRLTELLDPDMNLRSADKYQHAAAGFALSVLLNVLFSCSTALAIVAYTAVVYEAGQTDTAYSLKDGSGRRYAGQPGFGFGLLDIAFGIAGALLFCLIRGVL